MKRTSRCEETVLLRTYLLREYGLSTNALKRLKFREDGISVNGKRVTVRYLLQPGDLVELDTDDRRDTDVKTEGEFSSVAPVELPLHVVYEDACITVCDKPGDMPTHPSHGHLCDTAANALAFRALKRGDSAYVFRPVNRLDRNTSGLFLCANDFLSSGKLGRQLREGRIRKTYLCILCGVPACPEGTVDAPIVRADVGTMMRVVRGDGAPAVTDYRVAAVSPDGKYSLCVVRPRTGRTHQIRVHMAHLGCPLLGDEIYGDVSPLLCRHALHACRLEFDHPADGRRMVFTSAMPQDMADACRTLFLKT